MPWAPPDWILPILDALPGPWQLYVKNRATPYSKDVYRAAAIAASLILPLAGWAFYLLADLYDAWFDANTPGTVDSTYPDLAPPLDPPTNNPGIYPYSYDTFPPPIEFRSPYSDLRTAGSFDFLDVATSAAILAQRFTRGLYAGPNETTFVGDYYLSGGELVQSVVCDGVVIDVTDFPPRFGGIEVGGDVVLVPRLGWMTFSCHEGVDERQKVESLHGVYAPRNISRATGIVVKCKPGTEATVRPYIISLADTSPAYDPT